MNEEERTLLMSYVEARDAAQKSIYNMIEEKWPAGSDICWRRGSPALHALQNGVVEDNCGMFLWVHNKKTGARYSIDVSNIIDGLKDTGHR